VGVVAVTLERDAGTLRLARDRTLVEISLDPLTVRIERAGATVIEGLRLGLRDGSGGERLIQLTEGVIPEEAWEHRELLPRAEATPESVEPRGVTLTAAVGERAAEARVEVPAPNHVVVRLEARPAPFRLEAVWPAVAGEHVTGAGARHCEVFDQAGRQIRLGADRRYTGPDCPPDMLEQGGIPQGDYVPVPWLVSSAGWSVWAETAGPGIVLDLPAGERAISQPAAAGPLRLHFLCDRTPLARLRRYLRLTGLPALLPEWGYGHWKSRDVYEHQRDVEEDWRGYRKHGLPLDAIVIDSPWETQYNTWRFNPNQFPDPRGLVHGMRADGVRTVVWVTPWTNLDSAEGQRPPDAESERMHSRPADNYQEGVLGGHFLRARDGKPWVGRWWMGTGSIIDFTSSAARRWWQRQARGVLEFGVQGVKADDGEGYYVPPDARFADGRSGAEAAWAYGDLYRRTMQEVLDEVHPGEGVVFGRSGWAGQQATGMLWGGDQVSDWWSLRTLVVATLTAAVSGFSNWSHDVGGYLGRMLVERCPKELLLRWAAFGALSPLMQAHGRFEQEAWRYDAETLQIYRNLVLLHERLVPYIRAAAATASRCGLPIVRPLPLLDPADERGWTITDAYGFGPALWVAPMLDQGARERRVYLPRGEWLDFWTGEPVAGGRDAVTPAPLDRIPMWVRCGSILPRYPAEQVARGLGDAPEAERPLEATLWGRPECGRAKVRLVDGAVIRWESGHWFTPAGREVAVAER
jgi:alpha-glucosidase (family GH31 glycosyl hydrolase)